MKIRYKDKDGKYHYCEVADKSCRKRDCFSPGYVVHSSPGMYNGAWQDKSMSCTYRDYHGCPDKEGAAE